MSLKTAPPTSREPSIVPSQGKMQESKCQSKVNPRKLRDILVEEIKHCLIKVGRCSPESPLEVKPRQISSRHPNVNRKKEIEPIQTKLLAVIPHQSYRFSFSELRNPTAASPIDRDLPPLPVSFNRQRYISFGKLSPVYAGQQTSDKVFQSFNGLMIELSATEDRSILEDAHLGGHEQQSKELTSKLSSQTDSVEHLMKIATSNILRISICRFTKYNPSFYLQTPSISSTSLNRVPQSNSSTSTYFFLPPVDGQRFCTYGTDQASS